MIINKKLKTTMIGAVSLTQYNLTLQPPWWYSHLTNKVTLWYSNIIILTITVTLPFRSL